jgi:hypothetical protein
MGIGIKRFIKNGGKKFCNPGNQDVLFHPVFMGCWTLEGGL